MGSLPVGMSGFDLSNIAKYDHLIGGFCSGIASTAVCHPLDLLKTRFSANEGNPLRPQYKGYFDAARQIVRAGGFRSLYQGLIPNMTGNAMAWGLFFPLYNEAKRIFPSSPNLETPTMFLCGMLAGTCVMCVTNPIWVAKVRLMLQYENSGPKKYNGMWNCFRKIFREEGFAGLYKGFVIGIVGTTHGALQITTYNLLKDWRCRVQDIPLDSPLSNFETVYCSAISKIFATTLLFPYQVLRTRLQDHNVRNRGIIETTRRIVKTEGVSGLYKGCLIANIRLLPASLVIFVTYENVRHYIRSLGVPTSE